MTIERGANAGQCAIPRAACILPEQAGGRIPGAIVAIEQPGPVWYERQQHPQRFCQRAGEFAEVLKSDLDELRQNVKRTFLPGGSIYNFGSEDQTRLG